MNRTRIVVVGVITTLAMVVAGFAGAATGHYAKSSTVKARTFPNFSRSGWSSLNFAELRHRLI